MNQLINFFDNLSSIQKKLLLAIVALIVYALTTGMSYSLFASSASFRSGSGNLTDTTPSVLPEGDEDPSIPRTETCPLNGALTTKAAKEAWEKRPPLAVMIENHTEARPQSGLTKADIVYEAVAEGGITRFMAIYLCNLNEVQLGPIRSARTYFLDFVSEYPLALYAHVGGANSPGPANALGQIMDYKIRSLNQFGIGFPTYWRDYQRLGRPVATEHTMYSTTTKLWAAGEKKGWTVEDPKLGKWDKTYVPWKFKDDQPGSGASSITVNFWEGYNDFQVVWNYEAGCNCYKRKNGGADHTDLNNKRQISPQVVIVQLMKESRANDGYEGNAHLIYGTKGTGKALIFQDGGVTEGKWTKVNRLARTKYTDMAGKEISFNKGQLWIQTVPEGSDVKY